MHPTAFYLLLQAVPAALLFAALLSLGFQRGGVGARRVAPIRSGRSAR